ncbi:hypothetical protein SAMN05660420_03374 [Desulfuromusa kysingii]|uniref:SMODS-associating 2TM beta-strand rich effector domain-containing protein n=1 Tax=Desulfuromusa kysingii TaxID=37625 RepID=A0A1H4EGE3_9BACT|nr:hypothetical protein [Desulfuromusa kysingii]SEA84141.1 hypothetical protein SAMN05660420_03374 [Desulfuromusa kysingii]
MTKGVFILNFLYSFLATVVGGGILAFLFFWLREKIFPIPKIAGRWFFEIRTINTAYNPYKGMILRYIAMFRQAGNSIEGTVEKIYENSSTGEREYVGENRTRGVAEGYIEKNYFSKDRLILHVVEDGHGRESTNYYDLEITSSDQMSGGFSSMVANQDGDASWQRNEF